MCGIVGIVSNGQGYLTDIEKMNNVLRHRGPDGGKTLRFRSVALGHRRLSILDLSEKGTQPMCYKDRYWISFNGEIFNYLELKCELELKGYQFKSQTDTEVILAAYDCWNSGCFNRLNGMWALVIYDTMTEEIILSRDRFGIKPLYYYFFDNSLFFGSEIKAILAHTKLSIKPNLPFLKNYIKEGPKDHSSETAFLNVLSFPKASFSITNANSITSGNILQFSKYWTPKINIRDIPMDPREELIMINEFTNLLSDAVRLRLRADVNIGIALSGGLDSSLIASHVNRLLNKKGKSTDTQKTFSTVYTTNETKDLDESVHIDRVVKFLNVDSYRIEPTEQDVQDEYFRMIYHLENPPETTLMSSWNTYKLISQNKVKVTLDGQGADEQLCGYYSFVYQYIMSSNLSDQEAKKFFQLGGIDGDRLRKAIEFSKKNSPLKKPFWILFQFLLRKKYSPFKHVNKLCSESIDKHLAQLLHYADRASMAHSIESRMPFMDYRIVEFTNTLSPHYKLKDGWTKWIVRKSAEPFLPNKTVWRNDKMGWPIPEEHWFNGDLKKWLETNVLKSNLLLQLMPQSQINDILTADVVKLKVRLLNIAIWNEVFYPKEK